MLAFFQQITEEQVLARLGAAAVLSITMTNSLHNHHQHKKLQQQQGLNDNDRSLSKSDNNKVPKAYLRPIFYFSRLLTCYF
jgi:hypothetical protein